MNNSKKTVREIVLEMEEENRIEYEISHRGGTYGAAAGSVITALFPTLSYKKQEELEHLISSKFGVYCNYLGGGIRGAICRSDFDKKIPAKYAKRLDSFTRECKNRYLAIENESQLNDEEDEDGNTNWDAAGTNRSRVAGVKSAY